MASSFACVQTGRTDAVCFCVTMQKLFFLMLYWMLMINFEFKLWYEQATCANNRKAVSFCIPLVTGKYLLGLHYAAAMRTRKCWYGKFGERMWAVSTDTQCPLCSILRQEQTQILSVWEKPKMSFIALIFLFIPGEWCLVHLKLFNVE